MRFLSVDSFHVCLYRDRCEMIKKKIATRTTTTATKILQHEVNFKTENKTKQNQFL